MKADILTISGQKKGEIELPSYFEEPLRNDLIKRAFLSWQAEQRQPYGAFQRAGKESSASGKISHQRRAWKGAYGKGISRIPRKIITRRGSSFNWIGAFVSGTKGGRSAHSPKAEKNWSKKINKKENRKALYTAIAATANIEILRKRYEKAANANIKLPLIVEDKISEIKKTTEIRAIIEKLTSGLNEIAFSRKSMRSGRGKMRSRMYKVQKGLLLVIANKEMKSKAAENLGIEVVKVSELNIGHIAPGGNPGRLTIYTENAIRELDKK
jgi:large subunit ribosomal protein L4e